jgi:predicted nucleic acid-binding protein
LTLFAATADDTNCRFKVIFCDTSTLAKYYVSEAESAMVRVRLDAEDQVVLSELARAELMAVFHRRLREHVWSRTEFEAATRQFIKDDVSGYWSWRPLDSLIVNEAVKIYSVLPETIFLRTADCLHLVTALHHGFTEIHTHDVHQIRAASALGLAPASIA